MSDDDRLPDDDADTPRRPRARSIVGEIGDIEERRPRRMMTGDDRALTGFRLRDTSPLDAVDDGVPEARGEEPTPPIPTIADPDVQEAVDILVGMIKRRRRRDANHTLELEAAVKHVAPEKTGSTRRVGRDVATAVLIAVATGVVGLLYDKVRAVDDLHDRVLTLELRQTAVEKALGSISVLRVVLPGKDPNAP